MVTCRFIRCQSTVLDPLPRPGASHARGPGVDWRYGLLIYRTEPPLFSTRGQQADHLAIACTDLDAAIAALRVEARCACHAA